MLTLDRRFLLGTTTAAIPPALLLTALLSAPDLLNDAWQVPCFKSVMPEEKLREERLAREQRAALRQLQAQQEITKEVVAGRLTLLESAARLRDVELPAPSFRLDLFREAYRADSDDERFCQAIIQMVRLSVPPDTARTDELARRLEDELRDRRERGTLILPESGD